ncbi:MAG: chlorohydrolase, partial [Acetivibrio sp.]
MILIGNGKVLTRDASNPWIEDGAVLVEGTKIKKIGTTKELKETNPDAQFVDAKGGVIMPAFINMHEHIYSAMARGLSINGYNPNGFLDILDGM